MRLTVASHKGGVGKTTTALTLAHLMHLAGEGVTIVDLDAPSGTKTAGAASALRRARNLGIPAYTIDDLPSELEGHVVIDSPPDAANPHLKAALTLADIVIVPTGDSQDDLEVALAFVRENLTGIDYRLLLTRILGQSANNADRLKAALREGGYKVLDNHITLLDEYKVAAARGTTVAGLNTYRSRRATREHMNVLRELRSG